MGTTSHPINPMSLIHWPMTRLYSGNNEFLSLYRIRLSTLNKLLQFHLTQLFHNTLCNYSATFRRYSSRSNFRVSSTSATIWGETRPVSPIHMKNFLNEAR